MSMLTHNFCMKHFVALDNMGMWESLPMTIFLVFLISMEFENSRNRSGNWWHYFSPNCKGKEEFRATIYWHLWRPQALEQESEQSLLAQPSTSNELTNMMIVGKYLHFLVKRCLQTMMIVGKHLHFLMKRCKGMTSKKEFVSSMENFPLLCEHV